MVLNEASSWKSVFAVAVSTLPSSFEAFFETNNEVEVLSERGSGFWSFSDFREQFLAEIEFHEDKFSLMNEILQQMVTLSQTVIF